MLIAGIIATVLLVFFGVGYCLLGYNLHFLNWVIEMMTDSVNKLGMKEEKDLKGQRIYVMREAKRSVRVNLYDSPDNRIRHPLFLAFDGKFTGGDADDVDDFCQELMKYLNMPVISIAYTKIDVHVTTYPQDEIADTVRYFRRNASEYRFDMSEYALLGMGAGGYLSLIAATSLVQDNIIPSGLIFIDPFVDYVAVSFVKAGMHPGPVSLITTSPSNDSQKIAEYEEALERYSLPHTKRHFMYNSLAQMTDMNNTDQQVLLRREDLLSFIRENLEHYFAVS